MNLAQAVLIPIDVQRGFDFPPWGKRNNPAMEEKGKGVLAAWRQSGRPLIHVRHDSVMPNSTLAPGHEGNALRPGFEPVGDEPVVSKSVNCAFVGTDLDLQLRRLGADTLLFFGISTDMCVSTTVRIASNLGYKTIVVGDACYCFEQRSVAGELISADAIHDAHLATLKAEFAEVVDADTIIGAVHRIAR